MTKRNAENERMKHRYLRLSEGCEGPRRDLDRRRRRRTRSLRRVQSLPRFQRVPFRTGARLQGQSHGGAQRANGKAAVGLNHARDARGAEEFLSRGSLFSRAIPRGSRHLTLNISVRRTNSRVWRLRTDSRAARRWRRFERCFDAMPKETEIDKRDHALVAFTVLSGARDGAIISLRLKHIDIERGMIEQDAREVRTKRAKTFTTWFFPVGDDIRQIVMDWVAFLREQRGFGPDDPLFPKAKVANGADLQFRAISIDREPWTNANRVREIFRVACARVGLPYFNPHSLRNTLVQIAYDRKLDAEAFKAWSQNLGHESCLTTFSSYGTIPPARQAEIIRRLAVDDELTDVSSQAKMLRNLADQMQRRGSWPSQAND